MTARAGRSTPLRIALAGAGMISWYHLVAWRNAGARARVVAVCDPDPRRAAARAEEFGIPRVYQDPAAMFAGETIDALDVASPRETHAAWVEAAADRGIEVLCQKPLTPTLAEAEALVATRRRPDPPHDPRELAVPALVPRAEELDRDGSAG